MYNTVYTLESCLYVYNALAATTPQCVKMECGVSIGKWVTQSDFSTAVFSTNGLHCVINKAKIFIKQKCDQLHPVLTLAGDAWRC